MRSILFAWVLLFSSLSQAQSFLSNSYLSGSIETNSQYYLDNNKAGILAPNDPFANNSYVNLFYQQKNISAGLQFEGYNPALQGYPRNYEGNKIVRRFVKFSNEKLSINVGNFYEQFGNGLTLRTFEERSLGLDNSLDGLGIRFQPLKKLSLKFVWGKPRFFMEASPGVVRGGDIEWTVKESNTDKGAVLVQLGASVVNRFMNYFGASANFPESVTSFSGRFNINYQSVQASGEWVAKTKESNFGNDYIKKKGNILYLKAGWQHPSNIAGMQVQFRRLENADNKANFNTAEAAASINYTPALTRQHTFVLANIYPHAVQAIGEIGGMADFFFRFKKNTPLGGKYGTKLDLNFSLYHALDSVRVTTGEGFKTNHYFGFGKTKLFRDFNVSLDKRWTSRYKTTISFVSLFYNRTILQGGPYADVKATIIVADHYIKLKKSQQLRLNTEHLWTKADEKNWLAVLAEWSFPNGLSLFASDMINYQSKKINYYNAGFALSKGGQRLQLSAGQQRAGLLCVGGICRFVPSYTGLSLNYFVNL
jgi:hypothetical protein